MFADFPDTKSGMAIC